MCVQWLAREREVLAGRYGLSDREPETLDVVGMQQDHVATILAPV